MTSGDETKPIEKLSWVLTLAKALVYRIFRAESVTYGQKNETLNLLRERVTLDSLW